MTDKESGTEAMWRRMLREGELVFVGYCNPSNAYFDEKDDQTMAEIFLSKKHTGDKRSLKVRVSISVIKPRDRDVS